MFRFSNDELYFHEHVFSLISTADCILVDG